MVWTEILILLLGLTSLIFAELGTFVWSVRKCSIPRQFSSDDEQTKIFAAVSDIHVLGTKRSALDVKWTTWNLRKSFWCIARYISPDVLLSLGDHLDQGGSSTDAEWQEYVHRYRWATSDFLLASNVLILDSVVGNHDAQFASLGLTQQMMQRFEGEFGSANGIVRVGKVEIVWVNSMALEDESRGPAHLETLAHLARVQNTTAAQDDVFRILLSHVPLHRTNDLECGKTRLREGSHVTYVSPETSLISGADVLTEQVSQKLLHAVRPSLVLSGHLHTQCYRQIAYDDLNTSSLLDITVPTISYRMRPDPGFTVIALHPSGKVQGKTCKLPHEHSVIAMDVIALVITLVGLVGVVIRMRSIAKNKSE